MNITRDQVLTWLSYDPETGLFRWIKAKQKIRVGEVAGTVEEGYIRIRVQLKKYSAHRLAWLVMTGEWPNIIDHINGDRADNRWANLRNVTQKENLRNRTPRKTKTGVVGVTKVRNGWRARIQTDNGRLELGCFDTLEEAASERKRAELELGYLVK